MGPTQLNGSGLWRNDSPRSSASPDRSLAASYKTTAEDLQYFVISSALNKDIAHSTLCVFIGFWVLGKGSEGLGSPSHVG